MLSSLAVHLTATAWLAMLAVNGAMMKPSRSLMLTKVRLAEFSLVPKVYLQCCMMARSDIVRQPTTQQQHKVHAATGCTRMICMHAHQGERGSRRNGWGTHAPQTFVLASRLRVASVRTTLPFWNHHAAVAGTHRCKLWLPG